MGAGIRAECSALFLCLEKMELCGECEDEDSRNIAGLSMVLCICQQERGKEINDITSLAQDSFLFGEPPWWCLAAEERAVEPSGAPALFSFLEHKLLTSIFIAIIMKELCRLVDFVILVHGTEYFAIIYYNGKQKGESCPTGSQKNHLKNTLSVLLMRMRCGCSTAE